MKLASEILILVLMILSNGRVFATKKSGYDALVMLSPIAFLLAILHFFAFGVYLFSVVILVISLFVLLSNFHALFRFSSHLIVDRYSPLMITWSVITIVLSSITLGCVIYFSSMEIRSESLGVSETRTAFSGSFISGFREAENFTAASAQLFTFAPLEDNSISPATDNLEEDFVFSETDDLETDSVSSETDDLEAAENPIIIFVPDKRGDTQNYKPYLQFLAQMGFTCCSADFYARDGKWLHNFGDKKIMRRIALVVQSLTNNQKFMSQREFYTYNFSREFTAMVNLLDAKFGSDSKYFFVTDNLGFDAANDVKKKYPEKVTGVFDISTVASYKTSGYGFIAQTDPLLAQILGVKRDRTFKDIKEVTVQTKNAITGEKYDAE